MTISPRVPDHVNKISCSLHYYSTLFTIEYVLHKIVTFIYIPLYDLIIFNITLYTHVIVKVQTVY